MKIQTQATRPDKIQHPVNVELQINNEYFLSISFPPVLHGTYLKMFVVYLNLKCN